MTLQDIGREGTCPVSYAFTESRAKLFCSFSSPGAGVSSASPSLSWRHPASGALANFFCSLCRMARTRALEAECAWQSLPRPKRIQARWKRNGLKGELGGLLLRAGLYRPHRHLILSLCLPPCVGIRYRRTASVNGRSYHWGVFQ